MKATPLRSALLTVAAASVLSGCSPLPSFGQLRADTRSAVESIADYLPTGTPIRDRSTGEAGPCGRGTVSHTEHWEAYPGADFDGEEFIATLIQELPDEFVVFDTGVPMSDPNLSLKYRGMTVGVVVNHEEPQKPKVNILAISRCGLPPEEK
ncbi:hypothetical protein LJR045_000592 [Microbacterium sp. LjRoot45]|uniref:hypothetical protein n=1 Tax=Microbacterium sp. LjRoot45 TaxID=3342329 RepID=UPI003ED142E1